MICAFLLTLLRSSVTYTDALFYLGVLCCFLGVFIFIMTRKNVLQLSFCDFMIFLWWIYIILRGYIDASIPCGSKMVSSTFLLSLYFCFRALFSIYNARDYDIVLILMASVCIEFCIGIFQMFSGVSYNKGQLITGAFFNSGPYSAFIMMGMVGAVCFLRFDYHRYFSARYRNMLTLLNILVIVFGLIVFWITISRAAIISFGILVLYIYRHKYIGCHKWNCVLLTIVVIFFGILFYIKYPSFVGRLIVWYFSFKLIISHFFWGVGIGNFQSSYARMMCSINQKLDYSKFADYYDHIDFSYCDILQVASEQGLVGFIFFAILLGILLIRLRCQSQILYYICLSLILFSLSSYIFQLLSFQIIIVIFGAWINQKSIIVRFHLNRILRLSISSVFLSVEIFATMITSDRVKGIDEFMKFDGSSFSLNEYQLLYSSCRELPDYYTKYAEALRHNHRLMDSNAMLREGLNVSGDPMIYNMMGDNFKDMGFYQEAFESYRNAYYTLPNRLTPLFSIMKLYEFLGDKKRTNQFALSVVNFRPKIVSSATRRMKYEANLILNNK